MPRKKSLFKVTKPRVRVSSKGLRVTKPRARIGGKTGLNISSSGISGSTRTKMGTFNTKRGFSLKKSCPCSSILALILFISVIVIIIWVF